MIVSALNGSCNSMAFVFIWPANKIDGRSLHHCLKLYMNYYRDVREHVLMSRSFTSNINTLYSPDKTQQCKYQTCLTTGRRMVCSSMYICTVESFPIYLDTLIRRGCVNSDSLVQCIINIAYLTGIEVLAAWFCSSHLGESIHESNGDMMKLN